MKAKKGYRIDKPKFSTKNWLKRYFSKRTCKKRFIEDDVFLYKPDPTILDYVNDLVQDAINQRGIDCLESMLKGE